MRRRYERTGSNGHHDGGNAVAGSNGHHDDVGAKIATLTGIYPIDRYDGERWYPVVETRDKIVHCLSVTTAIGYSYPKDARLLDWIKKNGMQADTIRDQKAQIGIAVDRGTQRIDEGKVLRLQDHNREVYKSLISYLHWFEEFTPTVRAAQATVFDTRDRIAGTFDKLVEINGELHVLDVKKTSGIYPSHLIQSQVYCRLLNLMGIPVKYADVLRLGTKHKAGYEFVQQEYDPDIYDRVFRACVELWKHAHEYRDGPLPEEQLPQEISLPNVAPNDKQQQATNRVIRWTRRRR